MGGGDILDSAERAEQLFAALAAETGAFQGLSYRALGDAGLMVRP